MKSVATAAISGLLFAFGLGVAGMTDPAKVIGFLDVAGSWDPSLAFVMGGAMGSYALLRRLIHRRSRPVFAPAFPALGKSRVEGRILLGAGLFGVGWGIAGYCPGPALVSASSGATAALFVAAMVAGMLLFRLWEMVAAKQTRTGSVSISTRETPECSIK